jgi:hypothetical protein
MLPKKKHIYNQTDSINGKPFVPLWPQGYLSEEELILKHNLTEDQAWRIFEAEVITIAPGRQIGGTKQGLNLELCSEETMNSNLAKMFSELSEFEAN